MCELGPVLAIRSHSLGTTVSLFSGFPCCAFATYSSVKHHIASMSAQPYAVWILVAAVPTQLVVQYFRSLGPTPELIHSHYNESPTATFPLKAGPA